MITLLDISFWLNSVYFLIAIFLAFYIPGVYFISRLKLTKLQEIILSTILGMVLWGWQGFIFGYLDLRWFSYVYLTLFVSLWFKKNFPFHFKIPKLKDRKVDLILMIIFALGIFTQLTAVWFTGILTDKGLFFCCGNIADNILMISYTKEIASNFPPIEPGMFATPIQNYHYWGSIVIGELIRVFRLPLIPTNFQYMTVFISLFLGLSVLAFSQILNLGKVFSRWLILFLYLGGDLIWVLITIYRRRDFKW